MNTENNLLQSREEEGATYERALVASEFIDWLLQEGEMGTRAEAEQLGRRLLEHGIVQHGEAAAPGGNSYTRAETSSAPGQFWTPRSGGCGGYRVSPDSLSPSRPAIFQAKVGSE